jgi:hypothetical protein
MPSDISGEPADGTGDRSGATLLKKFNEINELN